MKTIFNVLILAIVLAACSKEDIRIVSDNTAYTFSIESTDQYRPFSAHIVWDVDSRGYTDNVKTYGYASGFELQQGQHFTLTAITDQTLIIHIYREDVELKRDVLTSGSPYTFKQ